MNTRKILCGLSLLGWCYASNAMDADRELRAAIEAERGSIFATMQEAVRDHDLAGLQEALRRYDAAGHLLIISSSGTSAGYLTVDGRFMAIFDQALAIRDAAIIRYLFDWIGRKKARFIENDEATNEFRRSKRTAPTTIILGIPAIPRSEIYIISLAMLCAVRAHDSTATDFFAKLCFGENGLVRDFVRDLDLAQLARLFLLGQSDDEDFLVKRFAVCGLLGQPAVVGLLGYFQREARNNPSVYCYQRAVICLQDILEMFKHEASTTAAASSSSAGGPSDSDKHGGAADVSDDGTGDE